MFVRSFGLAATFHGLLRIYAPTNVLLRHLRSPRGVKWAIPVSVALVQAYLTAASVTTIALAHGGPGWLNLVGVTFAWNAIKFAWMAVLAPVHLIAAALRLPLGRPTAVM